MGRYVKKTIYECKRCGSTWKFRGCACGNKKQCVNPKCKSRQTKKVGEVTEWQD